MLHNMLFLCNDDHSAISYVAENSAAFRRIWLQLAVPRRSTELQQVVFVRCTECMHTAVVQKNVLLTLWSVRGVNLVHQPALDNKWTGIFSQRKMRKKVSFRLSKYGNL